MSIPLRKRAGIVSAASGVDVEFICNMARNTLYYAKWQRKIFIMPALQLIEKTAFQPTAPEITDAEGAAMARATVNLFSKWGLSDAQASNLLGGLSPRTWARWKSGEFGRLPRDLKTRMSNLMGIHKALRIIFIESERGYAWISKPNEAFGGTSALNIMLGGELTDIMRVRRYLDAVRGG